MAGRERQRGGQGESNPATAAATCTSVGPLPAQHAPRVLEPVSQQLGAVPAPPIRVRFDRGREEVELHERPVPPRPAQHQRLLPPVAPPRHHHGKARNGGRRAAVGGRRGQRGDARQEGAAPGRMRRPARAGSAEGRGGCCGRRMPGRWGPAGALFCGPDGGAAGQPLSAAARHRSRDPELRRWATFIGRGATPQRGSRDWPSSTRDWACRA